MYTDPHAILLEMCFVHQTLRRCWCDALRLCPTTRAYAHIADYVRRLVRGNDKIVPAHAMKAYRGSIGLAPPILKLGIRWR